MNKNKLIELRCKAWGITEDEYYCNQCSDFSLEDMARAYRRGKNKGRADLENENAELKKRNAELDCQKNRNKACYSCANATERCFRNEIACPCQKYKSYKEENAELKKQVEQKQHLADVRLEQSLENYKLFSDERKARIDVDIALEDTTDKLIKAKELLRMVIDSYTSKERFTFEKDLMRAEQFLKE